MKELSTEQMESTKGGCSFTEMMFYANAQLYHIGKLDTSSDDFQYHAAGAGFYTYKLFACM
jgi:hypothetical protein